MTTIRQAQPTDAEGMLGVLTRAFDGDPVVNWVVRQDEGRAAAIRWVFNLSLRLALPHGHVFMSEDGLGVALWAPPGRWRGARRDQIGQLAGFVRSVGIRNVPRVAAAVAALEARHPRAAHYYLADLAVDPPAQGQGVGSALLRHVLDICDRRALPAYLENSNPRNTPLYERHGFRARERHLIGGDGPPLLLMWRDPGAS
jgi:GNAT superfamily N-acetyltransferase